MTNFSIFIWLNRNCIPRGVRHAASLEEQEKDGDFTFFLLHRNTQITFSLILCTKKFSAIQCAARDTTSASRTQYTQAHNTYQNNKMFITWGTFEDETSLTRKTTRLIFNQIKCKDSL